MNETITTILKAQDSQFQAVMSRSGGVVQRLETQAKKMGVVLAAAFGGARIIGAAGSLIRRMNELDDVSQRLELPVEEVQVLSQVASLAGSNIDSLAKATVKMRLAGIKAAEGSEEHRKALEAIGIEAKRFESMGTIDQLKAFAKGYNEAADKGAAFKSVMTIIGRNGTELIPVLRAGAAAIDDVARNMRVLSSADVQAVAQMSDQVELLAANLKNDLSKTLIALAPQIQKFTGYLSEAAQGVAVLSSPAGGTGMQGGMLGGVDILRRIDELKEREKKLAAMFAAGGNRRVSGKEIGEPGFIGGNTRKLLSTRREEVAKEQAALEARFKGIPGNSRAFAEQAFQFEKLTKSGLSGDALRAQMAPIYARTEAIVEALNAEQKMAAIRADAGEDMEKQATSQKKMVDDVRRQTEELSGLKSRVGARVMGGMPAGMRRDMAQSQLGDILSGAGVGSIDDLRRRIGGGDSKNQIADLKALDQALDKMGEIKSANAEIQSAAEAVRMQVEAQAIKGLEFVEKLGDEMRQREDMAKSRGFIDAELAALKMSANGQKAKADAMMREIELRKAAARLAEEIGSSEKEALDILRTKQGLENKINNGGPGSPAPGGGRRRPRSLEIGFGPSRLEGREGFLGGSSMLRNSEIERRAERWNNTNAKKGKSDAGKYWEKHFEQQGVIIEAVSKIGSL